MSRFCYRLGQERPRFDRVDDDLGHSFVFLISRLEAEHADSVKKVLEDKNVIASIRRVAVWYDVEPHATKPVASWVSLDRTKRGKGRIGDPVLMSNDLVSLLPFLSN